MKIEARVLADQFYRARSQWPFLDEIEARFGLPRCLLYAVGSRETNLRNVRGDGGHGYGVWQLDDRSHVIPPGYLDDVRQQALDAAAHLAANFARYGDWTAACNAYNSGRPQTSTTAGHDYGPDVMDRAAYLESIASPLPPPTPEPDVEDDMQPVAVDPETGDFWVLTGPDGGIDALDAGGQRNKRYYGNLIDHPEYNAGSGKPLGPAIGIAFWPQGQPLEGLPPGGYVIITRAPDGSYHPYHFDASTAKEPV